MTAGYGSSRCSTASSTFLVDTSWLHGEVTDKRERDGRFEVHLDVWCLNRADEKSSLGNAVILLPSKESGEVLLPRATRRQPHRSDSGRGRKIQSGTRLTPIRNQAATHGEKHGFTKQSHHYHGRLWRSGHGSGQSVFSPKARGWRCLTYKRVRLKR